MKTRARRVAVVSVLGVLAAILIAWLAVLLAPAVLKEPPGRERNQTLLKKLERGGPSGLKKLAEELKKPPIQPPRDPASR